MMRLPKITNKAWRWALIGVAGAGLLAIGVGAGLAGGAWAQGTPGAVRLLGPLEFAFATSHTNPGLNVMGERNHATNLPLWIRANPAADAPATTDNRIPATAVDLSGHTSGGGSGLTSVATDATITGDGTVGAPLGVANEFTAADESTLDGAFVNASASGSTLTLTRADGNRIDYTLTASGGLGPSAVDARIRAYTGQITATGTLARDRIALATATQPGAISAADQRLLEDLPPQGSGQAGKYLGFDAAGDYAALTAPSGGGGGLTAVTVSPDGSLSGDGTTTKPLSVANPFTADDERKLDDIPAGVDETPEGALDLAADYAPASWTIVAGAVAAADPQAQPTLTTAAGYTYGNTYAAGSHQENDYITVRVSATAPPEKRRQVRIGEADGVTDIFVRYDIADWTDLGLRGGFRYYTSQVKDIPAGDVVTLVEDDLAALRNVQIAGTQVTIDATGFDGNLAPAIDSAQKVAQALDDMDVGGDVPENARVLAADYEPGGWTIVANAISTTTSGTNGAKPTLTQAAGYTYANTHAISPREENSWVAMRLPGNTSLAEKRRQLRIGAADGESDPFLWVDDGDWEPLGTSGAYDYYIYRAADLPLGDSLVMMEDDLAHLRNVTVDWNQVTNKQLVHEITAIDGAGVGITLTNSLDTDSGVSQTIFATPIDLNEYPHGLLAVTATWVVDTDRSSGTISFESTPNAAGAVYEKTVVGFVSLSDVSAQDEYGPNLTPRQLGQEASELLLWNGQAARGVIVNSIGWQHTAGQRLLSFNSQYQEQTAATDTATTTLLLRRLYIVLLPDAAPRGGAQVGGVWLYDDTLPNPDGFTAGDRVWVKGGAAQGGYVLTETTTQATSGTGLDGLTIDPSADLAITNDGRYVEQRFNRTRYRGRGGSTIPVHRPPTGTPAGVDRFRLNYTSRRTDGELEIRVTAGTGYTGDIRYTLDNNAGVYQLGHISPGLWRLTGLNAAQIAALREHDGTLSAPGATGYSVSKVWTKVLAGAAPSPWVTLLDYNPATPLSLTANQLTELPSESVISPALTAADDDADLRIRFTFSAGSGSGSNNDRAIWGSIFAPLTAGEWRDLSVSSNAAAAYGGIAAGYMGGAAAVNSTEGGWVRAVIAKGTNGRIGVVPLGSGSIHLQRLQVHIRR